MSLFTGGFPRLVQGLDDCQLVVRQANRFLDQVLVTEYTPAGEGDAGGGGETGRRTSGMILINEIHSPDDTVLHIDEKNRSTNNGRRAPNRRKDLAIFRVFWIDISMITHFLLFICLGSIGGGGRRDQKQNPLANFLQKHFIEYRNHCRVRNHSTRSTEWNGMVWVEAPHNADFHPWSHSIHFHEAIPTCANPLPRPPGRGPLGGVERFITLGDS